MRAVLYSDDLEPITILSLNRYATDHIIKYGYISVTVLEPLKWQEPEEAYKFAAPKIVRITGHGFVYKGQESLMLFTEDDENALLLKSEFLPGQTKHLNQIKEDSYAAGFAAGFLKALDSYR